MALAPVRAAAVLVGDRLDGTEVGLPLHALEGVDGDVDGLALWAGLSSASSGATKRTSIGEVDRVALGRRLDRPHRVGGHRARQGVLHLGEADEPRRGEDAVGAIDARARARQARHEAIERRDRARERAADDARQLEGAVGQQDVVDPGAPLRPRARRLVDGVVGARQRTVGVREDEELEVAMPVDARVESVEDLGQRASARRRRAA